MIFGIKFSSQIKRLFKMICTFLGQSTRKNGHDGSPLQQYMEIAATYTWQQRAQEDMSFRHAV